MKEKVILFWLRRDLRLHDNTGLMNALCNGTKVVCLFIYDRSYWKDFTTVKDRRIDFIHQALQALSNEMREFGTSIITMQAEVLDAFKDLIDRFDVEAVYCNVEYEPYCILRDGKVKKWLSDIDIPFNSYKDQVIFHKNEIVKKDGQPYQVFTPYYRQWIDQYEQIDKTIDQPNYNNFYQNIEFNQLSLEELGYKKTDIVFQKPNWCLEESSSV